MNNIEPIAVVILAAGQARRMNAAKMLLPLHDDGRTMLDAAIAAASVICDKPIVVSGAYHRKIEAHLGRAQHTVLLIENQRWEEGMSSSISAGIRATKPSTTAALIVLADQPEVGAEQLRALVTAYGMRIRLSNSSNNTRAGRGYRLSFPAPSSPGYPPQRTPAARSIFCEAVSTL